MELFSFLSPLRDRVSNAGGLRCIENAGQMQASSCSALLALTF
jgi:hypothetical protein